MKRCHIILILCIVSCICCAPPKRDFTVKQIQAVDNLKEIMWVMATVADPRFKIAKQYKESPDKLEEKYFSDFIDMGTRLQVSAERLKDFSKGKKFDDLTHSMVKLSKTLREMGTKKDKKGSIDYTLKILQSCKACHKAFR